MAHTLLTVTGVASSGAGIAFLNGFRVFVPGALPGETVSANVEPPSKGVRSSVATDIEIIRVSPWRTQTPCPALHSEGTLPACGGCPLGKLSYMGQIPIKEALLKDALNERGVSYPEPEPLIRPTDDELSGFRNKAVFYPARDKNGWHFGMYAQGSHTLVEESVRCSQLPVWMQETAEALAKLLTGTPLLPYDETSSTGDVRAILLREGKSDDKTERLLTIVVREKSKAVEEALPALTEGLKPLDIQSFCLNVHGNSGNAVLGRETSVIDGKEAVTASIDHLRFSVRPETFLQVNTPQTARLYQKAIEWADIRPDGTFLDLYCGVGTMTLLGARKALNAVGVDIVEASIERAKKNAMDNGIENAEFYAGPVEKVLPELIAGGLIPQSAIIDPAFKGLDKTVPALLTGLPLNRLVYVSCSPVSFARDAERFENLGWKIEKITTVDLFPGALHVETVALFVKNPA